MVEPHVIAAAETLKANFSDGSDAEDAACMWMAIKLINTPRYRTRGKHMAHITCVHIKQLLDSELKLCKQAGWNFSFILFDHM